MVKLSELNINDEEKAMLAKLVQPMSTAQVAAKLDKAWHGSYLKLIVWEAKGWIKGFKTSANRKLWTLDQKVVKL